MDPAAIAAATVAALLASPAFALMINASVEAKLAARGPAAPALPTATVPPRHQGKSAPAQGGNVAPLSGSTGAPSGGSVLEQRIEDLTRQVAALAATNQKQLELIAELTRQQQPAAQRPGGPAAQQQAQAQRPGGPAAQQQAPAQRPGGPAAQRQPQRVVAPLRDARQQQQTARDKAVHQALQRGDDYVGLAGPASGTYAAVLARRSAPGGKGRRGAAAAPLAQALQPTAKQLAKLVGEVQATAVRPARMYGSEERSTLGVSVIGVGKAPADWKVTEGMEDTYRHVLLVGGSAVDAHSVVLAVEAMGKGVGKPGHVGLVSALVLAPPGVKADTTVAGVLASMGTSRAGLAVAGRVLDVEVNTTRQECVPVSLQEAGPIWSTGHTAMLTWRPQAEGAAQVAGRDKVPEPRKAPDTMRVVCVMQTQTLRQGQLGAQRVRAQEWARERCHEALRAALPGAPRPPMEVAWRGDTMEVTFVVRAAAAPAILTTSGQVLGVAFRPYVQTGVPLPLEVEAGIVHLRLPEEAVRPGPAQWQLLRDVAYWPAGWAFGGLLPLDAGRPTWLSVRLLGRGPVTDNIRELVAEALGVPAPPAPAVTLRVRGAGVEEWAALGADAGAAMQAAAEAVFGPGVKVQGHTWLNRTHISRPVYDLRVAGLPASLPAGPFCGPGDSRDGARSQSWARVPRTHKRKPTERVGTRDFLAAVQEPPAPKGADGEDNAMMAGPEEDEEDIL